MKKRFTLIVLAVGFTLAAFGQNLELAKKYIKMEQWKKAQKVLEDLTSLPTADSWSKFYMAEVYMEQGKVDDAQAYYDLAAADPKNSFAIAGKGRVFLHNNDAANAQLTFDAAIKSDKKNASLYAYIADAFLKEKTDTASAIKYISLGKGRDVKNIDLYFVEAKYWNLKKENGKEADCYDKRINLYDRQNPLSNVKLGTLYAKTYNFEAAVELIKKAIAIDSTFIPAYKALGDIYYWWKGHDQDASDMYKKYIGLAGDDATIDDEFRFGFVLFYNNEYDEAKKVMEKLSVADPNNYILIRLKAFMAYKTQDYVNGLAMSENFFKVQNDTTKYLPDDYEYLAKLQVENKMDSLAVLNYIKAYRLDSTNVSYLDEAANLAYKRKSYPQAASYYETLTRVKAGVPSYFISLGRSYFYSITKADTLPSDSLKRMDLWMKADTAFGSAISLYPTSYYGYYWRAVAITMIDPKGEKGLAKPYYEKTIKVILENTPDKKKELLPCYQYLAFYYYLQAFNTKKANAALYAENKKTALDYCDKMMEIQPNNQFATMVMNEIQKMEAQPQRK
jgi:Tfp pilus assembly protein PilF